MRLVFSLGLALALGACGFGDTAERFAVPVADITERERISYGSVEVAEVSLPTYAALEEIFVAGEDGALQSDVAALWADDPTRAVTLELSRALATITGARVAPAPWPFEAFPEVRVDARIEEMLADADGVFRLSGQYFVAPRDETRRDRTGVFSLATPWDVTKGAAGIAEARGRLVRDLALEIAQRGL